MKLCLLLIFVMIGILFGRPVLCSWNENTDINVISHYNVWKLNGNKTLLGTVPRGTTNIIVNVDNYDEIGVTAFRNIDGKESSMSNTVVVPVPVPTGFTVKLTNSRTMTFSWNPTSDISHYILRYGKNSNNYTTNINTTNTSISMNKFLIGYYYARLTTVNTLGQKSETPEIEIKVGRKTVTVNQ